MLFDKPTGSKVSVPAAELQRQMNSLSLTSLALPELEHDDYVILREVARHAALKLTLASQCYYRLHSDWPTALEDLVPEIIKELPADPFGKSGETLRLKRDGDELLINRLNENNANSEDAIAPDGIIPLDDGFRLKRP